MRFLCFRDHGPDLPLSNDKKTVAFYISSSIIAVYGSEATSLPEFAQFSSVAQLCPTLCDPMNHSKPIYSFLKIFSVNCKLIFIYIYHDKAEY